MSVSRERDLNCGKPLANRWKHDIWKKANLFWQRHFAHKTFYQNVIFIFLSLFQDSDAHIPFLYILLLCSLLTLLLLPFRQKCFLYVWIIQFYVYHRWVEKKEKYMSFTPRLPSHFIHYISTTHWRMIGGKRSFLDYVSHCSQ